MRLIDADKLMKSLNPKESVWVGLVLSELIANAPTVKAIPIEWIRNYVSIWISEPYKNFALNMIKNWEKENETN